MQDLKKRIERIEGRLQIKREASTFEDDCDACAWYADALEILDGGGDLAPQDQAIWNDIFENGIDATKAWKNGRLEKAG